MPRQPTVLGFEVENLSEVHQGKEYYQPLMLIHEGMATMGASALRLDKAVKQSPEKMDIVGEAWQSHEGTSWEMGGVPITGDGGKNGLMFLMFSKGFTRYRDTNLF